MAVSIHNGSVSKKEKILQIALKSPVHWGQLFIPSDFRVKTASKYHYEVGYIMDDKSNQKPTIFMLPRGHAKTKLTQASILKDVCTFTLSDEMPVPHFIVWVAQNKTQSMRNVNFIMNQIENNNKIRYYFGDLRGSKKWNQEELEFSNRSSLICRAGLHGIRGLLKDELRPNRFILDDFEYEGNTKTQHSRDSNATTVTSVIIPALDPEIGRLQINQTPVHYDCFILRIYDNYLEYIKTGGNAEDFEWKIYTRKTKIGNPLWPEYFNSNLLRTKKAQLVQANQLKTWFQEYEMEVTTDETALFGQKMIRYWDGNLEFDGDTTYLNITEINHKKVNKKVRVITFQGCDPSSDIETRTSSDTAIVEWAVDSDGNRYVLDYLCKKNLPDIAMPDDEMRMGTADQILIRSKKNRCRRSGVEKHAVSSGVFNSMSKIKMEEPKFNNVVVVGLSHGGKNKIDRIYNGLIEPFGSGKIHIRPSHNRLEREIREFGEYAKYIDLLDALEMCNRVTYKPHVQEVKRSKGIQLDPWEKLEKITTHNWKTV